MIEKERPSKLKADALNQLLARRVSAFFAPAVLQAGPFGGS
jgi:hypothetical protein